MRKIKILGYKYSVKRVKIPSEKGYCIYGKTHFQHHRIELNCGNCRGQDEETLIHEVFHVISVATGSNLSERQVTAMSQGLYAVLKDNKKLLG